MREAIAGLDRFLVTVEVAKHRFFRWAPADVLPSGSLVVFARSDDFFFGHSFESFPFPGGLTPNEPLVDIASTPLAITVVESAQELYAAREAALASGPQRLDMTELYDLRDQGGAAWLDAAHRLLDIAVAAAYGWSPDLSDDEILAALGTLHQTRQGAPMGIDRMEPPRIRTSQRWGPK